MAPYERSTENKGVYLFEDREAANWYANYMGNMDPPEAFDIWEVKIGENDLDEDFGLTSVGPDDPDTPKSFSATGKIERSKIRRIATVNDRFDKSFAHVHKYIKRLGMPGRFQYFYQEPKAKEKKKEVNAEDLIGSKYWGIRL